MNNVLASIKHVAFFVVILAAVLLLSRCSSNNCPLENTVLCNIDFYDESGNHLTLEDTLTVKTLLPGFKQSYYYRKEGYPPVVSEEPVDSLRDNGYTETISQQRRDTILVNKLTEKSSVAVPMSYFQEEDTLVFDYASISNNDTIIVSHVNTPHMELPECGSYMFHIIKNVTSTDAAINRILVKEAKVTYQGHENIQVYFHNIIE